MKHIKNFVWFLRTSPDFMGKSFIHLLVHEQLIKKAIQFTRLMAHGEKMAKKYGADNWYAMMDRIMEI